MIKNVKPQKLTKEQGSVPVLLRLFSPVGSSLAPPPRVIKSNSPQAGAPLLTPWAIVVRLMDQRENGSEEQEQ